MTTHITKYGNDPRVTPRPAPESGQDDGFTVRADDGQEYAVMPTDVFGWVICHTDPPNMPFVQIAGHGFAINIIDANHAIGALIGEPLEGASS